MIENLQQRERLFEAIRRACKDIVLGALADDSVVEIMRNGDGRIWLDRAGVGMVDTGYDMPDSDAALILQTSATLLDTDLSRDKPILEGEFPLDGSRLEGLVPPVAQSAVFAIRKKAKIVFGLDDYHAKGILSGQGSGGHGMSGPEPVHPLPIDYLKAAVAGRQNILIVGGTGSGKTTLANAFLGAIADLTPHDRVVAIEDTMELQVPVRNQLTLRSNEHVPMSRLLRATMRLRPDRIVVGEVRGGEAYTLLKAWNSGHPGGLATIHANNAREGLSKLAQYVYESPDAQAFSEQMIGRVIAAAVNTVVFIERTNAAPGRAVSEICRVSGFEDGQYVLEPISFTSLKEISNAA